MRWLSIAILVILTLGFSAPSNKAEAADFSFSLGFHDELSPYGSWVSYSNYGRVWHPNAYSGWRPYMDGYWGYTNYGPTWYGNEPYASYVYHYGNWIYTARYGWVWIPGYDWHAGNVVWSYGGGYIGWRPSFPSGYYYPGSEYNLWVVINADRFGYRSYRPYALRATAVRDLFDRRVFRTRHTSLRRADLERVVRRPLRVLNVRERDVRIGDRRARLLVTPDEEVRIRKHVTQVRSNRDRDVGRKVVEKSTVTRKDDDFGRKSKSKTVTKVEKKPSHTTSQKVTKVEKKPSHTTSKTVTKVEKKPSHTTSKTVTKVEKKPSDTTHRTTASTRKPDSVQGKAKLTSDHGKKKTHVTKTKKKVVQKKEKPKKD